MYLLGATKSVNAEFIWTFFYSLGIDHSSVLGVFSVAKYAKAYFFLPCCYKQLKKWKCGLVMNIFQMSDFKDGWVIWMEIQNNF